MNILQMVKQLKIALQSNDIKKICELKSTIKEIIPTLTLVQQNNLLNAFDWLNDILNS